VKQALLEKAIVCDFREKDVIKFLKSFGAKVSEVNLAIGDFVISNDTVIERKTHNDFISSIIDGRIFEQANKMKKNFENAVIIVEGFSNRKINENALKGAIATLLVNGVSVVNTLNIKDTARLIYWLAKKETQKTKLLGFKIPKKGKDIKKLKEKIVACLPGISIKKARSLLKRFKSVRAIFTASELELRKVKGIGEKTAKEIKEIVESKYE
jgi:Fanconi anemia group M protein